MPELTITQADRGKCFEIPRDSVIVITLPENPTTGYRWAVDLVDDALLALRSSVFSLASGAGIGGGGWRTLRFVAKTAGAARIQMKLWREWEGHASIIDRFDATIQIRDS